MSKSTTNPATATTTTTTTTTSANSTTTTTIQAALSTDEMIEMLKNLAAVNEKLHKWEQSMKKLETFPDSDINKSIMKDIIDL